MLKHQSIWITYVRIDQTIVRHELFYVGVELLLGQLGIGNEWQLDYSLFILSVFSSGCGGKMIVTVAHHYKIFKTCP